jgi:aminoglycoside phosphotransferase (APT) family kinase protein
MDPTGRPRTSTRDIQALEAPLREWLAARLRAEGPIGLTVLGTPSAAGLSSETVLFDVDWRSDGTDRHGEFVLRLPPPYDAFPLFPRYDLARQVEVMELVADLSEVPVPRVCWVERDPGVLGSEFYVMERVSGDVAPDSPLYVFGGWLADASAEHQLHAEHGMVAVLAGIHGLIPPPGRLAFLDFQVDGETPLRRHVANQQAYYDWIANEAGARFPLVEAAFEWLRERWPLEGPSVLSWGDARVANVLMRDFRPVAVLDWEAAGLAPREVDLGWMVFFHQYFQRIAERYGYAGIPDFLEQGRVLAAYFELTGYQPVDFEWFLVYAELRQALTSIRVSSRMVLFGEQAAPEDPEDLIIEHEHFEQVIRG